MEFDEVRKWLEESDIMGRTIYKASWEQRRFNKLQEYKKRRGNPDYEDARLVEILYVPRDLKWFPASMRHKLPLGHPLMLLKYSDGGFDMTELFGYDEWSPPATEEERLLEEAVAGRRAPNSVTSSPSISRLTSPTMASKNQT